MSETSPKVALESQTLRIPIFFNNAHRLSRSGSSSALTEPEIQKTVSNCHCPHVLVSDDDPFQAFYYQTLFQRSMDFDNLNVEKKDFRFELFSCGEDLLKKYQSVKECGCGSVLLVISDFSMGPHKLDGIQTLLAVRKAGYNGKVMLRTSEKKDYLSMIHRDFALLMKTKTITFYVTKDNHALTKETIEDCLKNRTS